MRVSPAQVEKFLKGTHYPAKKHDLIQQAKNNNANQDVMETLEDLSNQQFNSPKEVNMAMKGM